MKPVRPLLLAFSLLIFAAACGAQSTLATGARPVITQVYGGGGNSSATLTNDYVEIYNPTPSSFDLNGYSVQYANAAANKAWASTTLSTSTTHFILYPYHYYLVQLASGGAVGSALTTPDSSSATNMSATDGKIALVASTTANATATCPASFVNLVGFGSSTCSEDGTNSGGYAVGASAGATTGGSSTAAFVRKTSVGVYSDTGTNNTDFGTATPNPHSSKFAYAWILSNDGTANKVNGIGITTGVGANVATVATPYGGSLNLGGIAVDASGNAWYLGGYNATFPPTSGDIVGVQNSTNTRATANASYNVSSLTYPTGIAVDGLSNVWIVNPGNQSLAELSTTAVGTSLTGAPTLLSPPSTGFASLPVQNTSSSPQSIAIDISGNVWVADTGAAAQTGPPASPEADPAIYEIIGAAAPTAPLATGIANGTTGVRP